jgi:hypothetical protein
MVAKAEKNFGMARTADASTLYPSEDIAINCCLAARGGNPKD